jgi:arylsulfatase A-like enzyme
MNYHAALDSVTLPELLKRAGYQTHLCGKLHLHPERKLYGFCSADWSDGPYGSSCENDYERFLKRNGLYHTAGLGHGLSFNGAVAKPFHLDERFHFTNWCTECALEFLERRDKTMPFFLNVSYHQPHAPCTPPRYYFDKYMSRDLPALPTGNWEQDLPNTQKGKPVNAWRVDVHDPALRAYRAGYYGCIEHIDHQIGRLIYALPDNTIVIFCSDHGEMLGDHGWIRKRCAYEGSARVPLFFTFPKQFAQKNGIPLGTQVDETVELMDVMPTILALLGMTPPDDIDGLSLVGPMQNKRLKRDYIHGECARLETIGSGMQYLTDGKLKYIWYPALGLEQLFDLARDPQECNNLARDPAYGAILIEWRQKLIFELRHREEGFVRDGRLVRLDGPTQLCIGKTKEAEGVQIGAHAAGFFLG